MAHRVVKVEHDLRVVAAQREADHVVDLHLAARAHAPRALDAGIEVDGHRRDARRPARAARRAANPGGPRPSACFHGPARESVAVELLGNIGEQQLERPSSARSRRARCCRDLHARRGGSAAGRRQHPLALDLDHAGAAVAVRPHSPSLVAKMRNLDADARATSMIVSPGSASTGLPFELERMVGRRMGGPHVTASTALDGLFCSGRPIGTHMSSSGKYLMTHGSGFGAAWPRPQIDASRHHRDRSSSSAGVPMSAAPAAPPPSRCRRGRACTGRTIRRSKKRIRFSAARAHVVAVDRTIDRGRADEAAVRLQRVEVERDVAQRGRQDAAGRAAGQVP